MLYYLMWKNVEVMVIDISISGSISKLGKVLNHDLMPLQNRTSHNGIITWWSDRSIPIKQGKIEKMLRENGIDTPQNYLVHNLGLSLTDYYWIKPMGTDLTWEKVNLFENDFKENLLLGNICLNNDAQVPNYQPNSSLQGNLEKTWIIDGGIRKLIKGNHGELSSESINEVIISETISKMNRNAVKYDLIHIEGKEYDFGCISPIFTSLNSELVSAYAVITSEIKKNNVSDYEHFITVCKSNGLDEDYVRDFLEFEILIDFIFTNRDRHFTNISVLRNAETLKFESMAPIYDSGKSMMFGKEPFEISDKRVLSQETLGFKNNELEMLKLVRNRNLIDINRLPSPEKIRETYMKDSHISPAHTDFIVEFYKRKIDLYEQFAAGKNLRDIKFRIEM